MEKVASGTKITKWKSRGDYKDAAKQWANVESATDELKKEAVRHEHRALVARQGARDLLEDGKKKDARKLIEQMLSERNYVVACGVTARRIKRLSAEIKATAKRTGGITKRIANAIGDVEMSVKGSVLAEIEESLNSLEVALDPQNERTTSVIELVSTVKSSDVDQLQRELEGEISVLANLSQGSNLSDGFGRRRYKMDKRHDRGDSKNITKSDSSVSDEEINEEDKEDEEEAQEESEKQSYSSSPSEND